MRHYTDIFQGGRVPRMRRRTQVWKADRVIRMREHTEVLNAVAPGRADFIFGANTLGDFFFGAEYSNS